MNDFFASLAPIPYYLVCTVLGTALLISIGMFTYFVAESIAEAVERIMKNEER